MSALDYLLGAHIKADELRRFARQRGIDSDAVEATYASTSRRAWAASLTESGIPDDELSSFIVSNFVWGTRSIYDFPIQEETSWDDLTDRLARVEAARGDVVEGHASSGGSSTPQIAMVRQFSEDLLLVVTDEFAIELLDQMEPGLERVQTPRWTACALSRRPSSWRLEVHADYSQAIEVAQAVAMSAGYRFVLPDEHQVTLDLHHLNALADALDARVIRRRVTTHQEATGARKVTVEKSPLVADVREAAVYEDLGDDIDDADEDRLDVPWEGETYPLVLSRRGSFWFQAHTPRGLIDAVLAAAETVVGL